MTKNAAIVSDANVLIDIDLGGLAPSMFSLQNMEFCIPDILYEKEIEKQHSHFKALGLKIITLSGQSVANVFQFSQQYRKVSRMDLFALTLAIDQKSILFTGDKALRDIAKHY